MILEILKTAKKHSLTRNETASIIASHFSLFNEEDIHAIITIAIHEYVKKEILKVIKGVLEDDKNKSG